MKLSFILITYHREALISNCLRSISQQVDLPALSEMIIIDNAGDTQLDISVIPPRIPVHVERSAVNLGVAGGRNLGMKYARGDYYVFIDDDATWHSPNDIATLIDYFDRNPMCAALAVKSLTPSGDIRIPELPFPNKKRGIQAVNPTEVAYYYGVGHALRASSVQMVGNYPEHYFYAAEEIDLSLRLVDAGFKIVYLPSVAVHHFKSHEGRTAVGVEYWRLNALNKMRVAWRHLPLPYPLTTMLIWSVALLAKTKNLHAMLSVLNTLRQEYPELAQSRAPIKPATVDYLRNIGGRLIY